MNARDIQEKTLGVSHLPINTPTNSPTSLRSGRLPPQAGFLTSAIVATSGLESIGIPDGETDLKGETKSVDIGFMFGVDISFKLSEEVRMAIGTNYTFGFSNWDTVAGVDLKNSALGFTVGLSFPLYPSGS